MPMMLTVGASDTRIYDLLTFECVARLQNDERRAQHEGFQCVLVSGARTLRAASGRMLFHCEGAVRNLASRACVRGLTRTSAGCAPMPDAGRAVRDAPAR